MTHSVNLEVLGLLHAAHPTHLTDKEATLIASEVEPLYADRAQWSHLIDRYRCPQDVTMRSAPAVYRAMIESGLHGACRAAYAARHPVTAVEQVAALIVEVMKDYIPPPLQAPAAPGSAGPMTDIAGRPMTVNLDRIGITSKILEAQQRLPGDKRNQ